MLVEIGLPLLLKRAHALLRFLGFVEEFDRAQHRKADAADAFAISVEGALGERKSCRRPLGENVRPSLHSGVEFGEWHDLIDEAHLQSLLRCVLFVEEPHLSRALVADMTGHQGWAPPTADRT